MEQTTLGAFFLRVNAAPHRAYHKFEVDGLEASAMLFELVYNSVSVPDEQPANEIDRILLSSCRRNLELGVTGVLVYHRGEFIQLLEGSKEAVLEVYNGFIVHDPRHTNIVLDWTRDVEHRSFADWSMGFAGVAELTAAGTPGLDEFLANGTAGLDLSGPEGVGRTLLTAIYATLQRKGT
jgi:hypothetical protein